MTDHRVQNESNNLILMNEITSSKLAGSSAERLIEAVLDVWETKGHAGISARNLCKIANLPVSGISYHFGGLEQLLCRAQEVALQNATVWCEGQKSWIHANCLYDQKVLGPLLAALIDDWCVNQRRLALAWREGQLLAGRNPGLLDVARAWRAMWREFWTNVLGRFDLQQFADVTIQFFDGQSMLHLIRWNRVLDRACHEELCQGWTNWLCGESAGKGTWREVARDLALGQSPSLPVESAANLAIASAAGALLGNEGHSAVTHRAVAKAAGVSLGTVLYHFRTSAELIHSAFEAIYRTITADLPPITSKASRQSIVEIWAAMAAYSRNETMPMQLLALDELFVAASRDETFLPFAAAIRYTRGKTSERQFGNVTDTNWPILGLDAAVMSVWSQGLRRDIAAAAEGDGRQVSEKSLKAMLDLLHRPD